MADLKISQLTAATTPLAGTEVLPIVQSSSTKKATIANVQAAPVAAGTANGVQFLNASKVPTTGSALTFDGTNLGVGTASPTRVLDVLGTQSFQDSAGERQLLIANDATLVRLFSRNRSDASAVPMAFFNGATENLRINTNSDVTVNLGNLVIGTAGKGVSLPGGITWTSGAGSPEGVVTAPVGSLYSRSDGGVLTSLYVKQSGAGNTGWVGK